MQQPDVYQIQDAVVKSIGLLVYEDREGVIMLLRKNGVVVDDKISDNDLISTTILAVAHSQTFRKDLGDVLAYAGKEENASYVNDDFFNETGKERRAAKKTEKKKTIAAQGGTKVGLAVKSLATPENIGTVVNTGLAFLSQKLTAKADKESIAAATDLEAQKAISAKNQAEAQDKKNKWIMPVVIIGVLAIGLTAFFLLKKKK